MPPQSLTIAVVLLSASVVQAARPTAEEVQSAVTASRAEYAEKHPPLTQNEKLIALRREIARLKELNKTLAEQGEKEDVARHGRRIKDLQSDLRAVQKKYDPEPVVRLASFTYQGIKEGSVGRLNDDEDQKPVHCVQVLRPDEVVCYYRSVDSLYTGEASGTRTRVPPKYKSPFFIVKGIDASTVTEDAPLQGTFDVVITGSKKFTDANGVSHTAYVAEVFRPGEPFE